MEMATVTQTSIFPAEIWIKILVRMPLKLGPDEKEDGITPFWMGLRRVCSLFKDIVETAIFRDSLLPKTKLLFNLGTLCKSTTMHMVRDFACANY